jgi:3-methyladenine DNA glycosylase Tag
VTTLKGAMTGSAIRRPSLAAAVGLQLRSQGYSFGRRASVYAFMQNVGVVNDHVHGCLRAADYAEPQTK